MRLGASGDIKDMLCDDGFMNYLMVYGLSCG